ncbi:MAG: FtsQ-type POTRA domain-containing protein [Saccharospirillaceae bacterium]|nr:FtsQ-type POTRA domain-containing protein [Pseudomonadales bacterium]NRB78198.1 FtsQ-type POTRA domain-containing protein [Saccharospirillaceae bacterium]
MSNSGATKKVQKNEFKGLSDKLSLLKYSVIIFLILIGIFSVKKYDFLPVKVVNIPNADQFKCQDFVELELVVNKVKNLDFIDLDLNQFQSEIEQLDWIKSADIQFIWPDILNIDVQEYYPIALWNKKYLLSEEARILPLGCTDLPTVHLIGPEFPEFQDEKAKKLTKEHAKKIMSRYQKMAMQFSYFNMSIQSLEYKKYGSWEMIFDSNLVIRMSDTHFNLEFERLLVWLRANHHKLIEIYKIDTRYQHGLVVGRQSIGVKDES